MEQIPLLENHCSSTHEDSITENRFLHVNNNSTTFIVKIEKNKHLRTLKGPLNLNS